MTNKGIDATCSKTDSPADPYVVPAYPAGETWVLAVVKGGAGDSANELYFNPQPGDELSHATAGNSHVIICAADAAPEPTRPGRRDRHPG